MHSSYLAYLITNEINNIINYENVLQSKSRIIINNYDIRLVDITIVEESPETSTGSHVKIDRSNCNYQNNKL